MPCLLYYRPKHTNTVTLELANEWGLGYAFSQTPEQALVQGNTPDGNSGAIFQDAARAGGLALLMDREKQTWEQCAGTGCWVGYWNEYKPTPEDLARNPQLVGNFAKLGEGNEWKIPLTRRFNARAKLIECVLPSSVVCNNQGRWVPGAVKAAYAHLWELTKPFADDYIRQLVHSAPPTEFSDQELCDAAVTLIQTNYAVGAGELSLLKAFDTEFGVHPVIMAACNTVAFLEWSAAQKKTLDPPASSGVSTVAGETG